MLDITQCKKRAVLLSEISRHNIELDLLANFDKKFNDFIVEYKQKHLLSSTSIKLYTLESFREWLPDFLKSKDFLMPVVIDKMVNDRDLYYFSLYNSVYSGTDLIPDLSQFHVEYYDNGGGDHALAMLTGCYWMDHQSH